jgi:RNA polymerase sigma-70 factor (ECF subfamily)
MSSPTRMNPAMPSMTSPGPAAVPFDEVIAQAAWLKRFARALVGDGDEANDIANEALVRAWQHPPTATGPLRPWLATLVRNLVRSQARGRTRRERWHRESQATAPAIDESHEARLGRWELWKRVVAAVDGLDEPFRQTVMQRYFDDRSAAEIARQAGIPEATVRGRLKTGLDRVRQALDREHGGDRARWAVMLAPLAWRAPAAPLPLRSPPPLPPVPPPPRPTGGAGKPATGLGMWPITVSVVALLMLLFGSSIWRLRRDRATASFGATARLASTSARGARGTAAGGPPRGKAAAAFATGRPGGGANAPALTLATCLDQVARLDREQRQLDVTMARMSGPRSLFRAGAPNPGAEQVLRPLLVPLVKDGHGQATDFELECRELACRVTLVLPSGDQRAFTTDVLRLSDTLGRFGPGEVQVPEHLRDALTREPMVAMTTFFGLQRQDAGPVKGHGNGNGQGNSNDHDVPWQPVRTDAPTPTDLASCATAARQLQERLDVARRAMKADARGEELLAEAAPNPKLEAELTPLFRTLSIARLGSPIEVACRGRACRLTAPAAVVKRRADWARELLMHVPEPLHGRIAGSDATTGEATAFISTLPPGFEHGSAWVRRELERRIAGPERDAAIEGCRPGPDTRGTIAVEISVTTAKLPHDTGETAPLRYKQTGTLAGTAGGDCVADLYQQWLRDVEVPDTLWESSTEEEYEWK